MRWTEEVPRTWAQPGWTVAQMSTGIGTYLNAHTASTIPLRYYFLINLGTNDIYTLPDSATWVNNYTSIVETVRVKFSNSIFFLSRPWKVGETADAATMATWIAAVISKHPDYCFVGDDEAIWLEGGDAGTTMTADGVHYSAAGVAEKVQQMLTILGY